jgi:superfamily II DNA or RNA helicase
MSKLLLRGWQADALIRWEEAGHKGIVSVVTGGGKTVFALACVDRLKPETTIVVVPTIALLDQWWEETANYFDLELDEIHVVTKGRRIKRGTVNLVVLNSAATLVAGGNVSADLLIVDECHKAASPHFRSVFTIRTNATLGLSATPERPYDQGLRDVLIPALGEVIFEYTYREAQRDQVIVPFKLHNIVFELEADRQTEYDKLTRKIARTIDRYGVESQEAIALLLRRSRVLNMSLNRVRLAVKVIARNKGKRILVFHEDIEACNLINEILAKNNVSSGVYHSRLRLKDRVRVLADYRRGDIAVLVTCRALDEGFNVPETEIGIVAASTATRRQRIQRLGRVLRPAKGKEAATIYTLAASGPEMSRLREEESDLDGVADVTWSQA